MHHFWWVIQVNSDNLIIIELFSKAKRTWTLQNMFYEDKKKKTISLAGEYNIPQPHTSKTKGSSSSTNSISNNSENDNTILKQNRNIVDSEGNTLTEQQQEYFKDSKVRDEDGNLKVMYHGTPTGGFTVFKLNDAPFLVGHSST